MPLKLKEIKASANVICQMVTSANICPSFEILADFPDGEVLVDLLTGDCSHSLEGEVDLPIGPEMQQWFASFLTKAEIPDGSVATAKIVILYRTDRVPTHRKSILLIDLEATSQLKVADYVYDGASKNTVWCHRGVT